MIKALFTFFAFVSLQTQAQLPTYVSNNQISIWYPFSNNTNDFSVNAINGVNNGATLTTDRFSNSNSAYSFNGSASEYIYTPHNNSELLDFGSTSASFSVWFKTNSNSIQSIIHKRTMGGAQGTTNYHGYTLFIADGILKFDLEGTDFGVTSVIGTNNFADNNWHNAVVVRDVIEDKIKLYVDGQIEAELADNTTSNTTSNTDLYIGKWTNVDEYSFNGSIDDLGFWKRSLTICEIQDLYFAELDINSGLTESNGGSLSSLVLNAEYQWVDCDNNFSEIVNETSSDYQPSENGNYAVITDLNGCVVTSDCINVDFTIISEIDNKQEKKIIKTFDLYGREIPFSKNQSMIILFEDGTTQHRFVVE